MSARWRERVRRWRERSHQLRADQSGSAVVEFVLVSALLTVLTLSVIQLALALHIRNTVLDAAAEGARYASLADTSLGDGVIRTRDLISTALSPGYASNVSAATTTHLGQPAVVITVNAPLPLIGLVGIKNGLEVSAHAAIEQVR
ncbi:TadE/TadG family type IV pilus assembly protein [Salinibacterium sp. SWN1162]|uniref:TadE/TadG family type IV pilus assembly protein n=1 Tax=Salinibacterium sp. SWN1162 TaxID=2792053 RepID=UPI0018CD75B9|nr:TadE family protein [Salinibacterium sp. SWN1162]MBH0009957.1 pilus assembly protein [Salinibacterium sp. SWN1162]